VYALRSGTATQGLTQVWGIISLRNWEAGQPGGAHVGAHELRNI
jgi:hypothetical protein